MWYQILFAFLTAVNCHSLWRLIKGEHQLKRVYIDHGLPPPKPGWGTFALKIFVTANIAWCLLQVTRG